MRSTTLQIEPEISSPVGRGSFFRSVPAQLFIAGLVSVAAPGMWDALGGLGAGGAALPYAVSAANALVYGLMVIFCISAGGIISKIGLRYSLALGVIGYPLYGAGLYTNNKHATTWFMLFGSAICGISAGFFWAAEATIWIGYPAKNERGRYLSEWVAWKNLGPIIGGAISLGINAKKDTAGSVGSATYLVFISIMCVGLPVALCLSPVEKVWRKDGTKITLLRLEGHIFQEIWKALLLFKQKRILLLLPTFFISYFVNAYSGVFLTLYFTVRARALSSFITNFAGMISSFLLGCFLDSQRYSPRTRALVSLAFLGSIASGTWIWAIVLQKDYYENAPVLDWSSPGFGRAYALIWFWSFQAQLWQNFSYWVISHFTDNLNELARYTGLFRSMEALGQTVAWAITSNASASHFISIGINFGGVLIAVGCAAWLLKDFEGAGPADVGSEVEEATIEEGDSDRKVAQKVEE